MNDLKRMENFYNDRAKDGWSIFNCYPFFLDCKQTYLLTKILNDRNLKKSNFLDMAVLTSITDNEIRYKVLEKALTTVSKGGVLILYDYFDEKENFLNDNYRCLSLSKVKKLSEKYEVEVYRNVYMKSKYVKGLCKLGLKAVIPMVESLKIFNDSYHFVVIKNEK